MRADNWKVTRRLTWWGVVLATQVAVGYWWWMAKTHGPVAGNCRHMDPEAIPFCLRSLRLQTPLEAVPVGRVLLIWLLVDLALLAAGVVLAARRETRSGGRSPDRAEGPR